MNDPNVPPADSLPQPSGLLHAVQEFTAQYAAAILAAVVVAMLCFPGNQFLPVPWHSDDYKNLSGYVFYHRGHWFDLFCTRPFSTNLIWYLGGVGQTTYYVVMFLLTALLPVLAVRLALRLFRCRPGDCPNSRLGENGTVPFTSRIAPGPWMTIWLVAAVSGYTFLSEFAVWFYRYTGIMTNLTSVVAGMLAAHCFCRFLDGKSFFFILGCLLSMASAFAKEDTLLFVPLFVLADWRIARGTVPVCILPTMERAPSNLTSQNSKPASPRRLALVLAALAFVFALLLAFNKWIVPSPFTDTLKQDRSLSHVCGHICRYVNSWPAPRIAFVALAIAAGLGLLRRGHRIASLASLLLPLSLILPYSILTKFEDFYSLNWLTICAALSSVGIAVALRPLTPRRLAALPWILPAAVMAAAVLLAPSATRCRRDSTEFMNRVQESNSYILQQVLRRRAEFADGKTIALKGLDEINSPWLCNTGRYINSRLGMQIHWLLVAKPGTLVANGMTGKGIKYVSIDVVSEQDLAAHPGITILTFDKNQTMTIHSTANR
jgi:hypothetical protein